MARTETEADLDRHAYHQLKILQQVENSPKLTNRVAAQKLGVSVKLAHELLTGLVTRGLLHIRKHHARRWDYFLTPKGIAEKARLTYQFVEFSMQFYREARRRSADVLRGLSESGVRRIAMLGATELAEIATLGAREWGIEVEDIFDDDRAGEQFLGHTVRPVSELESSDADAILITAFDPHEPMARGYLPRGVLKSNRHVWIFENGEATSQPESEAAS